LSPTSGLLTVPVWLVADTFVVVLAVGTTLSIVTVGVAVVAVLTALSTAVSE
jgi:hypothetical protein